MAPDPETLDGPLLWTLCAITLALGFVLATGPGVLFGIGGLGWAIYLLVNRVPGVRYLLAMLSVAALLLLAAWEIF